MERDLKANIAKAAQAGITSLVSLTKVCQTAGKS